MAKLTDEQKQALTQWVADGATLNDVQSRLKEDFSIVLTYFDTRLLVMELGLTIQDKKRDDASAAAEKSAPAPADDLDEEDYVDGELADESEDDFAGDFPSGNGNVTVTLDSLAIPGTMASGKATFSDSTTVGWYLDQQGRLGLRDAPTGYQPPAQDIPAFQRELQKLLR